MPVAQEPNKRPGVCYALTTDGVELPIVDVTHPAFALSSSDAEQRQLLDRFLRENRPFQRLPKPLRNLLLRLLLRGSVLAIGLRRARGTFMSGLDTYLLKLGPEMLGRAYSKPIDRRIAASIPAMNVRLRLQDVARLMADALAPFLQADPRRPLHFVNIAGGPAIDSVNTLILLGKENADALKRPIAIDVLDLDEAGPAFGAAAVEELTKAGAPLHGLPVAFRHVSYDWKATAVLAGALRAAQAAGSVVICSSEGGLFEYGSDEDIAANLEILRRCDAVVAVVGSVTRADEPARQLQAIGGAALRPRGIAAFRSLVEPVGWRVLRVIERPFSDQVLLARQTSEFTA